MPIMSYLAYPVDGKKDELMRRLRQIKECSVHPADNRDLLVLVTDTNGREEETILQSELLNIDSLAFLALVAGYDDPEQQHEESTR